MSDGKPMSKYQASDRVTVKVKMTRHMGNMSVEYGAECIVVAGTPAELNEAYDECMRQVIFQHHRAIEKLPGAIRSMGGQSSSATPTATETMPITMVEKEVKKGKPYYKVKGGKYVKWGVRIWPDPQIVEALPFDLVDMADGDNDVSAHQLQAVISMDGDKPIKVLEIVSRMPTQDVTF